MMDRRLWNKNRENVKKCRDGKVDKKSKISKEELERHSKKLK